MPLSPLRPQLFVILLAIGGVIAIQAFPDAPEETQPPSASAATLAEGSTPAKLVVLVVFDQMRGDYPGRWEQYYDKDGFGKLLHQGAWFQNCHYPYAYTVTAAGHASLSTGCTPSKHGIIGNDWHDRTTGGKINAVHTAKYREISLLSNPLSEKSAGPDRLRQPTVGDSLKGARPKAKVVSLSIKDRSAIMLAALKATACYWFNSALGLFVTSTAYKDAPDRWVETFNRQHLPDQYFGKAWTRLRPDLDYAALSGPDDVAAEDTGFHQGRTFPHPTTGGQRRPGEKFYDALINTPYGNDLLLAFAKRAIDAEQLGQRDTCDLLCLSFSSNDLIGHTWGPDSQEVLDVTLRSDLIIKELLAYLDQKVGKDRYVVVVSADHGVAPMPEVAQQHGIKAARLSTKQLVGKAAEHLQKLFAPGDKQFPWITAANDDGWVYLNQGLLKERNLTAVQVEQALADWFRHQPGVLTAYTRTRLMQGRFTNDEIGERVRQSFYAERSGDVAVILQPYYVAMSWKGHGTNHGTPHPYDTHVPLLVYGAGIRPGIHTEPVTPLATAAIIARALGVPPPRGAQYPVPKGLFY